MRNDDRKKVTIVLMAWILAGCESPETLSGVDRNPLVEHGEYLVHQVLVCVECHTEKDGSRYANPMTGPPGAGGECFGPEAGIPGIVCSTNLTSDAETGLGTWTDEEILRATREGVGRDGEVLFPMMPFNSYRSLSDDDARAMIAYLRTLPAVRSDIPRRELHLPAEVVERMRPPPLDVPVPEPDRDDPVSYGRYLATLSACISCHTPIDERMRPLLEMVAAGGREFPTPNGIVRSSNLTPHETGWGGRTVENFVGVFHSFKDDAEVSVSVGDGQMTVMPWLSYADMREEDLRAIFAYMMTLEPVDNAVARWESTPSE